MMILGLNPLKMREQMRQRQSEYDLVAGTPIDESQPLLDQLNMLIPKDKNSAGLDMAQQLIFKWFS